jgi:hypothetical protein
MQLPDHPSRQPAQPEDGLARWDAEAAAAAAGNAGTSVPVVRLDGNEHLLLPFTTSMTRVMLHFVESTSGRGYYRCAGADCLLCRLGRQAEVRDLLPVYDPIERAVVVLPISPNIRPAALRPQIAPVLRQLAKDGARPVVLGVRKLDGGRFTVSTHALPDGVDDGAVVVKAFCQQLEAGQVALESAYPLPSSQDMAEVPEIATAMRLRGVTL